jgi:hypothetical protein
MNTRRATDYLITKSYFIEHGTNPRHVNARKSDDFIELLQAALLEIIPRGHHYATPLNTIYIDLLDAHFIAERARPITMPGMTYGEWVRWYEVNIMPTLTRGTEDEAP